MEKEKKPKEEKFTPSYDSIGLNNKFTPSYDNIEANNKFITSYDGFETNKKFKPFYGRPRRSILNLFFDYYKILLGLIVILIIFYLFSEYFS
ncbi:MAG: hypothetical protein ACXACX_18805 [Candidatus Hodarchaeales archaeon]|jgi:hypothetical protein